MSGANMEKVVRESKSMVVCALIICLLSIALTMIVVTRGWFVACLTGGLGMIVCQIVDERLGGGLWWTKAVSFVCLLGLIFGIFSGVYVVIR